MKETRKNIITRPTVGICEGRYYLFMQMSTELEEVLEFLQGWLKKTSPLLACILGKFIQLFHDKLS